jgi:shikimate dehydrogenase
VLLGAGGAGAAVAHAALELGVRELAIFDLDRSRARQLASTLGMRSSENLAAAMAAADGLIHCTPTGMAKMPGLTLDPALLEPRHWVAEIVYVPLETELLRAARAKGCRTVDGGGMAVFQAAGAFRLFTGIEPDAERMLRHFRSMG